MRMMGKKGGNPQRPMTIRDVEGRIIAFKTYPFSADRRNY